MAGVGVPAALQDMNTPSPNFTYSISGGRTSKCGGAANKKQISHIGHLEIGHHRLNLFGIASHVCDTNTVGWEVDIGISF